MPTKAKILTVLIMGVTALAFETANGQGSKKRPDTGRSLSDVSEVLRSAAAALNMVRMSDIGAGNTRLPGVDVVNTMQVWGSATMNGSAHGSELKAEYHAAIAYNPPAMRIEMNRTDPSVGSSEHAIQVVREKYAWDESELGGGLLPGKGMSPWQLKNVFLCFGRCHTES